MNKVKNKLILFSFPILAILTFFGIFTQAKASDFTCTDYGYYSSCEAPKINPEPSISKISPNSVEKIAGAVTITIKGYGFTPDSIIRKNGTAHPATFIDEYTFLIDISESETKNKSEIFLTVYNGEPGGGYSNARTFVIKSNIPIVKTTTANTKNSSEKRSVEEIITTIFTKEKIAENEKTAKQNPSANDINEDYNKNSLVANALLGTDGFMPSGVAQWIMMILAILFIITLWRYIHNSKSEYMAEPMKHA